MSGIQNYLGKKREKIFSIVKQKKSSKNLLKSKSKSDKKTKTDTSKQPYSLYKICRLVFEFLKKARDTTGSQVTDFVINALHSKRNDDQFKNIQRRVYDSLNVMTAAGFIIKDNKKIRFLRNEIEDRNEKEKNNYFTIELKEESDDDFIKEKKKELEEKQKYLIKRYLNLKFKQKYQKLNEAYSQRESQKKLSFPFDLFIYNHSSPMKIVQNEDFTRALLLSSQKIIHYSPYDIIKRLVSVDILSKLNDINSSIHENNLKQNISNSKKNENGESLLDNGKINKRINDKEIKETKKNEGQKKIKFNDCFTNYNGSTSNKNYINSEEKDEFLVLNYLKNLKAFKDELSFKEENKKEKIDNSNLKENKKKTK